VKKAKKKNEWVVYPEPQFTMEELIQYKMSGSTDQNETKIDVSSVKPLENILDIPKEEVVVTEVPSLVDQNQGEEAPKELTEEEKRLKFVEAIKQSHIRYKPKKHFGTAYKAERKRKNKAQRKSRKLNRK
jgi:hypothetical protein